MGHLSQSGRHRPQAWSFHRLHLLADFTSHQTTLPLVVRNPPPDYSNHRQEAYSLASTAMIGTSSRHC